ncbi:MAG TPA: aspartate aminotransferase family protein [Gemmata sp.]|nr:aspartate aminotransferase family protein [Gemmata sp.]
MSSPTSAEIARRYAAVMTAETAFPVVFKTGTGCHVEDLEGKQYVDFISGYGVVSTGWQRPEILAAMEKQMQTACFAPPWLPTREAMQLAESLLALSPSSVQSCARATGGADANEIAIKAHFALRGGKILTIGRAYHGGTTRTLSLSDSSTFRLPPTPVAESPRVPPAYCYRCPYGKKYPGCSLECVQAVEDAVRSDQSITGILLEPVIGSGGAIVPPQEYFDAIQQICGRNNLTLILDEVMTGCGRLGTFLAAEAFGLKPQAITLAKGLGGGYVPIGATLLGRELSDSLMRYDDVSATLAWTPLACAAALANLRIIQEEKLALRAREMGGKLLGQLRELFERLLPARTGDVRGKGLLIGIELVKDQSTKEPARSLVKRVVLQCLRGGLMIGTSWDWQCLIIMPPLTLDEATMAKAMNVLEDALKRITRIA